MQNAAVAMTMMTMTKSVTAIVTTITRTVKKYVADLGKALRSEAMTCENATDTTNHGMQAVLQSADM